MTDLISDHQLGKECDSIAADIFAEMLDSMATDETPDYHLDSMFDRAHEAADGHQWVIYTHYALSICAHCNTDNGEAFVDDVGLPQPFSLGGAATAVAYGEMKARIDAELQRLADEWEDTRPTDDEAAA